jgi:lambda family phage portal protein
MFDVFKSWFSSGPKPGSSQHARQLLIEATHEAYRLARRDRPREHYQPHGYSGDSAIRGSHDLMNRRTRDLVRNTAQAKSIINSIRDLVIGTGLQTFAWPFLPSELFQIGTELESLQAGNLGPRLTYALESDDLFEEWSNDPEQFDVEGRMSWPEMQAMLVQESATVGDGLLIRSFVKDYKLVPLAYQIIEREQLDESKDRPASTGKNKILGGREFNAANRVVAYHLWTDHPHEFFGTSGSMLMGAGAPLSLGSKSIRIPAERVIDLALFHRPSASMGVSWLDACGQSIWDRDSYIDSEIRSAAVDAAFSFVAKLEDAELRQGLGFADETDDSDEFGNRSYKVGQSPIASVINPSESLEMIRSARPNKDAPSFIKMLDRDTMQAAGLSYYSGTGDYEATNFSSTRAAKLDEDLHIKPLQNWVACHAALPVRRQFNAVAAAGGLFTSITPSEFRRNERTYQRFDAIGNGRDLLDPFKEGEARTTRLRTCMSTFKEECARNGKHWIRVLMQKAIEGKVSELFGVPLDFSKTGGDGSGSEQNEESGQDEESDQQTEGAGRAA